MQKSAVKASKSKQGLYQDALKVIPGGVNSPVRAFKAVGGEPVFVRRGKGPWIWDEKGKKYLDFCASWGPLIFGHAPEGLVREVKKALRDGTSFGACTAKEVKLAQKIRDFFPSMEKTRLVSSGTEAVMSAVRLARGFTSRKKILKIDGGYHGHVDSLLVKAGSGGATFGVPDSAGIPEELSRLTLTIPFNDFEALQEIFKQEGEQIAAFILEPVPANMGVVLPKEGYLEKARAVTQKYGSLLIFDEVITGFRVSKGDGPAGDRPFGREAGRPVPERTVPEVNADLTCLGKILGGGFPLAAFGGCAEIMDQLAPEGPVYQAGTLSGNPIAVTAALWMLENVGARSPRPRAKGEGTSPLRALNHRASEFFSALNDEIRSREWPVQLNFIASMFTLFFTPSPVTDYVSAKKSDTARYAKFFHACLKNGVTLAPSQFEANFISTVHQKSQLDRALSVFVKAIQRALSRRVVGTARDK